MLLLIGNVKHEIKHYLQGLSDDSDFDIGAWPIGVQHGIT